MGEEGPFLETSLPGPMLEGDVSAPPPGQVMPPPPAPDYRAPTLAPPRLVPEPQAPPAAYSPTRGRPRLLWGLER